jgi:hypothetical protein
MSLCIAVPKHLLPTLEASLYTNIPNIDIKQFTTPEIKGLKYLQTNADPSEDFLHDQEFKKDGTYLDPLMDIIALFEQVENNTLHICTCIDFDPKQSLLKKVGWMFLNHVIKPIMGIERKEDSKDPKNLSVEHLMIRVAIGYHLQHYAPWLEQSLQSTFTKFCKSGRIKWSYSPAFLGLQLSQAINLFHLPSGKVIDNLTYLPYRKLQFPNRLSTLENVDNKNDLTIIGKTDYKNQAITFGITREDKLRHMYIIGKTGTGKSNLIANLARSDMISNKGLCVIDPHGDLIDDIIAQVPSYRINDIVLFDVSDREWPVGFNVLEHEKPEEKPLIASGIVSIFKKLFGHSWGPRLEYILRNVLLSILEYPNATLMHVLRMLTDDNFRADVLEYVKDPVILKFWKDEFESWPEKQREEAISPITNKVGQFTSSQIIRNIFWQSKSKINFRRLMDEGKIVLINLSKGKIGEDSTNLLGSFVVSKIQIDAMSRADLSEAQRKDFYLYIDEFQNFATESFASILSEARKYKLGLIVANQYSSQLDEITRGAIFGNVGTIIAMTLGYDDAVIMANQFKSMVSANDFLDIPKYKAYIKLSVNWIVSDPFTMQTIALPPGDDVEVLKEKIRQQSRSKYAISRIELEELIKVRAERSFSKTEKAVLKAKEGNRDKVVKEVDTKTTEEKLPATSYQLPAVNKAQETENKNKYTSQVNSEKKPPNQLPADNNIPKAGNWKLEAGSINYNIIPPKFDFDIFEKFVIDGTEPDYILRDALKKDHKIIFHAAPKSLISLATLDTSKPKWGRYKKGKIKIYQVYVDMYAHNTLKSPDKAWVDIWIGGKEGIIQQVQHGFTNKEKWFLVDKEEAKKLKSKQEQTEVTMEAWDSSIIASLETDGNSSVSKAGQDPQTLEPKQNNQTLENSSEEPENGNWKLVTGNWPEGVITEYAWVKVGKTYEWYVKLKYNYGLFVTVGELDGLLHKKLIDAPDGVSWKKLYEIGDPIIIKAIEIKQINDRVTVARTQV